MKALWERRLPLWMRWWLYKRWKKRHQFRDQAIRGFR